MEITEVRIKLMEASEDRLRAFCSITFDNCFVVRDLKIIEGTHGPFVAMPSRKLTSRCGRCGMKNYIRSHFCNNCGSRIKDHRGGRDDDTPNKLYADVAHPINQECRDRIQSHVIEEYQQELLRAKLPGYISRYDDSYEVVAEDFSKPVYPTSEVRESDDGARVKLDSSNSSVPPPHLSSREGSAGSKEVARPTNRDEAKPDSES